MKHKEKGRQGPRLPGYEVEYLLFGALLAYGNRLQVLGDGVYHEVTTKQWFLLACLELFETPPTLGDLACAMGCSHQNAKQLASRLAQKGYVVLQRDSTDARRILVTPGPASEGLRRKYHEKQAAFIQRLFAGVSKQDAAVALAVVQKIDKNVKTMQEG